MTVLRTVLPIGALLVGALVATALPAAAAPESIYLGTREGDRGYGPLSVHMFAAKARAVEAELAAAEHGGNAIERGVLEGVRDFYAARNHRTLWFSGGEPLPRTLTLSRRMQAADEYGLDPSLYATPTFVQRLYYDPERLAAADVAFSRAVARFVTHIASGRLVPGSVHELITLEPEQPDIGEALEALAQTPSIGQVLAAYEPPHPQYWALKAALAELRALGSEEERIVVPDGRLLRPGMSDERVPLLRARLDVPLEIPQGDGADELQLAEDTERGADPEATPDLYDDALVLAVETFQEENGLSVDGIVGPRTLFALNGRSRAEDIASIIANLERWRWMPRDLGDFHILVNVPEFMARVVDEGTIVHETRVVVGTPRNKTPTFTDEMEHVVVNPYWNVPLSILRNELLPEIRANPYGYFARHGYEVLALIRGRYRLVHPGQINWYAVNPRSIRVRQTPGAHNALGQIKFMFPNEHAVYLHDTPSKSLFSRDRRAYSHGCVRVHNPMEFAGAILPHAAPEWSVSRLEQLFGRQERQVNLDVHVPVHLAYFTTTIGPDGALSTAEDIYGYDRQMTDYLGS